MKKKMITEQWIAYCAEVLEFLLKHGIITIPLSEKEAEKKLKALKRKYEIVVPENSEEVKQSE